MLHDTGRKDGGRSAGKNPRLGIVFHLGENEKAMQTYSAVVLELKARYLAPSLSEGDNALQIQPNTTDVQAALDFTSQGRQRKTPYWDELVSLLENTAAI